MTTAQILRSAHPIHTPATQFGRRAGAMLASFFEHGVGARPVAPVAPPSPRAALTRIPALTAAALVLACGSALAVDAADAAPVGWHPAVSNAAAPRAGIDPNTFLVGHPASPTNRGGHANSEHPAVLIARQAREPGHGNVDANTFIVQPPAVVTWRVEPAESTATRLAQAGPAARPVAR